MVKLGRPKKDGPRHPCGKLIIIPKVGKYGRHKIPLITEPPPKQIILEQVLYWLDLQATAEEVAGSFHVSVETLNARIMDHFGMTFTDLRKRCVGQAKLSLRRFQFKQAEKSTTMAIWLGKQWLGQKDDIQLVQAPNHDLIISLLNEVKSLKGKMKEYKDAQEKGSQDEKERHERESNQESGISSDETSS